MGGNGKQRWLRSSGICFVCLTCGTSSDILLHKVFHSWPPVVLGDGKKSAGDSWVARCGRVMVLCDYPPLKLIVIHNDQAPRVPPMMVFGGKGETGGQVLNGVCEEVLRTRNAIP